MVTNFDYLKKEPKFSGFANVAISAERIIIMDPEASIINSRRAMEFAISGCIQLTLPWRCLIRIICIV